ncbi:protein NRT1/ PTR FAMILY 2.8-like [Silene latifolia]|uniref:protein NRT1/ PTR FAMILY 2.8-like n=1 Tax=Silene latifolia TaxID=37657 RepID=UPI003D76AD02
MEVESRRIDVEMGDQISSTPDNSSRSPSKTRGGWRAVKFIIVTDTFEKMATVSLFANITVYLRKMYNMDGILLLNVVNVWNGSTNILTFPGAILSDAFLGRFYTVLLGSVSCMLGMLTMTLGAGIPKLRPPTCNPNNSEHCIQAKPWQLSILFTALILIAIGSGGIRPCNVAFGTDQFDSTTEKGRAQLARFYNWWYFSFTVSLALALTGLVYIQTNISWTIGFGIPTGCFVLSISIYLLGCHTYIFKEPKGSIFIDMVRVFVAAFKKRKVTMTSRGDYVIYNPHIDESSGKIARLSRSNRLKFFDKAAVIVDSSEVNGDGIVVDKWRLCSVQQVEQLKCLIGVLPVTLTGILCNVAMDQQGTFGVLQALQINRKVGNKHFVIPPAWITLTCMASLSIWILIYENIILGIWRKLAKRSGVRWSVKARIRNGIVMAILCMTTGAVIEFKRREAALKAKSFVSPIAIWWMAPQLMLSGLIEAFAAVSMLEFLTTQMPEELRSLASSLYFLCSSMSSYLCTAIVNIMYTASRKKDGTAWLGGHDLNKNRLDYYYAVLACIEIFNLFYFTFVGSKFMIVDKISPSEASDSTDTTS